MIVNKNENIRPFDVDGTLIIHEKNFIELNDRVQVLDPVTNEYLTFRINKPMVRLLKEEYKRGSCIKVWSRGGWEWANNVVIALNLEPLIHEVLSKPLVYMDDSEVSAWLKDRVFIGPDERYKE
jgi:hypothetical protein